jgi:hypothetical protein
VGQGNPTVMREEAIAGIYENPLPERQPKSDIRQPTLWSDVYY